MQYYQRYEITDRNISAFHEHVDNLQHWSNLDYSVSFAGALSDWNRHQIAKFLKRNQLQRDLELEYLDRTTGT